MRLASRSNWVRRRWLDFRQGHSVYLIFLMTFANFVTIQFSLLVDRVPALNSIFPNLWIFAAIFVLAYAPLAVVIGYWHRKSQWKVEQEAVFNENVIGARMWLFMLELIEGNVSDEEKIEMRSMLRKIIRKEPIITEAKTKGLSEEKFESS
jgi:magnesium-transporting ATPase (P-type)